jgi:hypothetical protein
MKKEEDEDDRIIYKDTEIGCIHFGKPRKIETQEKREEKSFRIGCEFLLKLSYSKRIDKIVI